MFAHTFRIGTVAITLLAAWSCGSPRPDFEFVLPSQLGLTELSADQRELLRATVSVENVLAESPLAIASDLSSVTGRYPLSIENQVESTLRLRLYGAHAPNSREVLLAQLDDSVTLMAEGPTEATITSPWVSDGDGIFDVNRNGRTNLADLLVDVDPAPAAPFVVPTESALQLDISTATVLQRQIVAIENRSPRSIVASANVLDAPGVYISPLGVNPDATARPQRLLELGTVPPFASRFVAVSFIPPSSFFLTGAVLVRGFDPETLVAQSSSVTLIGNPNGALQPIPDDDAPGATPSIADYAGSIVPFPRAELFSGLPISSVDPSAETPKALDFTTQTLVGFPADAAYFVSVPSGYRFYTLVTGLNADVDLTVLPLGDNDSLRVEDAVRPALPGTSPESVELPSVAGVQRLLLLLGVVEPGREPDTLRDLPFSLTAHVVAGPEFAAVDPVAPSLGPSTGGTVVQIRGSGFSPAALVFVGGVEAGGVTVNPAGDSIDFVSPALAIAGSGSVSVPLVVQNPAAPGDVLTSATLPNGYVYLPPSPVVSTAEPSIVSTLGGTPTRISGLFFSGDNRAPTVRFDGVPAAAVTWLSDNAVVAVAPPASNGPVDVTVETHFDTGTSLVGTGASLVTFAEPTATAPSLNDLSTDTLSAGGGDTLALVGENFADGATVLIGGVPATSVTFVDSTTLTVEVPPGEPGFVDVTIINPDGQTSTLALGLRYVNDCLVEPGGCVACGNGQLDPGEQCDDTALNGASCESLSFDGGALACSSMCFYDLSGCTRCGNGGVELNEDCEPGTPPQLGGESCVSQGFVNGALDCASDCTFDASGCDNCGDALCQVDETNALCAADCAPGCGDAMCLAGETCLTCPFDCSCNTPFAVSVLTGDGESAVVGQAAITGLLVRVDDALPAPLVGLRVEFTADPGVHLAAAQATTNTSGHAATGWTAGNLPGAYTITAEAFLPDNSSLGPPVSIQVTVTDVAPGDVFTVINRAQFGGNSLGGGLGVLAQMNDPRGLAIDADDNLYVAERNNDRVLRLTPEGALSVYAGGNGPGFGGDLGLATAAQLNEPSYLTFDLQGRLLISDGGNSRIRRVDAAGNIDTIVGGGSGGDGVLATEALLAIPLGLVVDDSGVLWFAEQKTPWALRRVGIDQIISTPIDANADPVFQTVTDVTTLNGLLYVAGDGESNNFGAIGRHAAGVSTGIAGNGIGAFTGTAQIRSARVGRNVHIEPYLGNRLLVAAEDGGFNELYLVDRGNTATLIMGGDGSVSSGDYGPAAAAGIDEVYDVVANSNGDIYVSERGTHSVRMIRSYGPPTPWSATFTVAGNHQVGVGPSQIYPIPAGWRVEGPGGPVVGLRVTFSVDQSGAHLVSPSTSTDGTGWASSFVFAGRQLVPHMVTASYTVFDGEVVQETFGMGTAVETPGTIVTIVNTIGGSGNSTGGPASQMQLNSPVSLAVDTAGALYFQQSTMAHLIDPDGLGSLLVGVEGVRFGSSHSEATIGPDGTFYFAHDGSGNAATYRIRERLSTGTVAHYANNTATSGCTGNIPITATFLNVTGLATDSFGNLFVTDNSCDWLRQIDPTGTSIVTLVGPPCSGAEPLAQFEGLAVGPSNEVYVSGPVTTCAGAAGYSGDVVLRYDGPGAMVRVAGGGAVDADNQPATDALLTDPAHLAVDAAGDLYIVETDMHRIRRVSGGMITTVVGTGVAGGPNGVESVATAQLDTPEQIAFGPDGNMYIVDWGNNAIRMVVMP